MMQSQTNKLRLLPMIVLFTGLPIVFFITGDFPRRSLLKESISLLTIIGLCLILVEFFLTRSGHFLWLRYNMVKVISTHKIIGYVFLCVFLVHPFLIVLPRYFEAGADPADSLMTIFGTSSNPGVLTGILAWGLMLLLFGTALFRKRIPLSYKKWVTVHRWLAIAFIIFACWHALNLGRHTDLVLSTYILLLAFCSIALHLKDFILPVVLKPGIAK
jgi:predicted ferric reductase